MEMISANGERHGLINVLGNSVSLDMGFKNMTPERLKQAESLKKDEHRIVKARYINHNGPSERLTKPYMRWAGDPIQIWHLIPGEAYDLPFGFVKEINDPNKRLKVRSEVVDFSGKPTEKEGMGRQIHELVPLSF